jgi:DHA2 family multidrug resistance protein
VSALPPSIGSSSPSPASVMITSRPIMGIFGVLLGAMIASFAGRLISVGLVDLRGALHLGVDEASWIGTAFNAAMMFIGPFSVYLGGLLGPRRVLLFSASAFTLISILLPYAPTYPAMITLLLLAGLTAGTFYPLTLAFILRNLPVRFVLLGIAMYAMDIVFTTNVSTSLEAWYMDHLSWRWIFWNSAVLTPIMMVLVHFGIPAQPIPKPAEGQSRPNWRGFLYASLGLSLLYIALDQGQRLDWLNSGTIVGLVVSGTFLLLATAVRRLRMPNPLINFKFLAQRNILLLGLVLILFRFVMLATVLVIPNYLTTIQGYRALQTGPVLLWVALPQCACGLLAMYLLTYVDARLILTTGFALVAIACLINAQLTSAWSGTNFWMSQIILAIGFAFAFNGLVGASVLQAINTGALNRPIDILTYSGFFQTLRLFGGELGTAFMQHFVPAREQFHSNILGLSVQVGQSATDQRLLTLRGGMASHSTSLAAATERAAGILGLQVRQQAFTLAITDSFMVIAWSVLCVLLVIACMARVPTQYRHIVTTTFKPS